MSLFSTPIAKENIFTMLGIACGYLRQLKYKPSEIQDLRNKVFNSKSYDEACSFIEHYFPLKEK